MRVRHAGDAANVRLPPRLQGPRMVRDVFRLAKQNAPSIIFVDEVRPCSP